jgi:hypothetical protein
MMIDCHIPGGNILVEHTHGDEIFLRPDIRDTEGEWFYWYFRVRGADGKRLTFRFDDRPAIGARGAAVSLDRGDTWRWLSTPPANLERFEFAIPPEVDEVRFSVGMPYTQTHWEKFLTPLEKRPEFEPGVLCISRQGRPVESLRAGRLDGQAPFRILITARHHACEMMASYALEGILQTVAAQDETGAWLRENVEFLAIPFVDKDGVENGDQGKNRRPHDHNRDYADGLYPETTAIRAAVQSGARLDLALDLHCPWLRGGMNEWIYLVGLPYARLSQQMEIFSRLLECEHRGPLPYTSKNNLPWGVAWNTDRNPEICFDGWAAQQTEIRLAATIELPYANASGVEVNPISARAFGRDLAQTIHTYLHETTPPSNKPRVPAYSLPSPITPANGVPVLHFADLHFKP